MAPDNVQLVDIAIGRVADRADAPACGTPLVLLQRYRGTMDDWAPSSSPLAEPLHHPLRQRRRRPHCPEDRTGLFRPRLPVSPLTKTSRGTGTVPQRHNGPFEKKLKPGCVKSGPRRRLCPNTPGRRRGDASQVAQVRGSGDASRDDAHRPGLRGTPATVGCFNE